MNQWLEKEIQKDQKELLTHKNKLIAQIKKVGVKGIIKKPQPKSKEPNGIWKKMKKFLGI